MQEFIGKQVIVRADRAGVFFGTLASMNGSEVILSDARKIFYWDGASAVEQLALDGVANPKNCKFTVFVEKLGILGVIQIIPCTEKAIQSIKTVGLWKR